MKQAAICQSISTSSGMTWTTEIEVSQKRKRIHSGKLTEQWKSQPFCRNLPGNMVIFHGYVSLPEGKLNLSVQLSITTSPAWRQLSFSPGILFPWKAGEISSRGYVSGMCLNDFLMCHLADSDQCGFKLLRGSTGPQSMNLPLKYDYPWTPKPWKMKVLNPQYMGYNP